MLTCEGYKMFYGTMRITPIVAPDAPVKFSPQDITGTWLYKPEYDCWYCKGWSYVAKICTVIEDKTSDFK